MTYFRFDLATLIAFVLATSPALAQTQRSGGGGETQKFMQQYQQLAAEKTSLQAQLVQMKKDLDASKTELEAMTKERNALKAQPHAPPGVSAAVVAKLTASRDAAERNLEQNKQRTTELVNKFRDMAGTLKDVEADRNLARSDLAQRNSAYDKCAADNLQLFEITTNVLDRYEHVGMFTRVSATEPFTKITRTRIDNLMLEYRERALQLREKKTNSSPGPAAPSSP